jgi:hypothetical protein
MASTDQSNHQFAQEEIGLYGKVDKTKNGFFFFFWLF